jgi:membrane-associated phospholipid phosphatase
VGAALRPTRRFRTAVTAMRVCRERRQRNGHRPLHACAAAGPVLVAASLLTLGTVYGQFHYAVDAVAGAGLAAAVVAVSRATRVP